MRPNRPPSGAFVLLVITLALAGTCWASSNYKVLHAFNCTPSDGCEPSGTLTLDHTGNLYGATHSGGDSTGCAGSGCGIVFELTRSAHTWRESILYSFCQQRQCADGSDPSGGLILDPSGSLYGTTYAGGIDNHTGTAFQLTPGPSGWKESVLYDWGSHGGLVRDRAGDLYGLLGPGAFDQGAVGELTPASGGWNYTMLYSFGSQQDDGNEPYAGLTWDAAGNLYGTTIYGGDLSCSQGCGTIFQLSPGSGGWQETVLHRFSGKDGQYPYAGVIFDHAGNLYTVTDDGGGGADQGTVFKLSPGPGGKWKGTVLHRFQNPANGAGPVSTPVMDSAGNLYGTAHGGDPRCGAGCGVVYKLTPRAKGPWKYTILHKFHGPGGFYPDGGVVLDNKGHLYGTTVEGGTHGYGVVYEITP